MIAGGYSRLLFGLSALLMAMAGWSLARAEVVQSGLLRVDITGAVSPRRLPREGTAPVAVSVGWKISTTDGSEPQKLKTVKIEINRYGVLDLRGLPVCPFSRIQPASTERALANCKTSRVGSGRFAAQVGLEGQEDYVASGKMIVFRGERNGKPLLYGHIYSESPFTISFVIPFEVRKGNHGTYGTSLTAKLPASLRTWGNLTEVDMRLSRSFRYKGRSESFISAGCPTPKGISLTAYSLARTAFGFEDGTHVSSTVSGVCKVRN